MASLLLLIETAIPLYGQSPGNVSFHQITQKDGLSQSTGHTILQDSQGFMWFGTNNGLNRYDGYEMTVYMHNPKDSTTLSGNSINVLFEDSKQNLWIGTMGAGLNHMYRDNNTFRHYKADYINFGNGLSDNSISAIYEDEEGLLWVGTYNGLNILDPESGDIVNIFISDEEDSTSLSGNQINTIYEDRNGYLWIGTNDGLNLWLPETETFSHFRRESENPDDNRLNNIMAVYQDAYNNLWAGTTNGLNRYNYDTDEFERYLPNETDPYSISGRSIVTIYEDSQGIIWIGTENNGLNAYDRKNNRFIPYEQNLDDPNSISGNAIYSIYENDDGILWIGTYSGGINYVDRKKSKFENYTYQKSVDYPLSHRSVTSFLEDSEGNFWVGTDGGGLNRFDRETGNFYTLRHEPNNPNSLSSDVVLAMLDNGDGSIWLGYYHGGISKYDVKNKQFTHYRYDPEDPGSLCHDDVFAFMNDPEKGIWIGTNGGGVCHFDEETETFTQYQAEEGVIRDLLIDSEGHFWLATYGGGLKMLLFNDEGIWNFYQGDNGLQSNVILTIHEDQKNRLWVGTKEAGLNFLEQHTFQFTNYTIENGLPSDEVKGILEDDSGNLWLSTNNGLSKFNPETKTFFNYSIEDGLQGSEYNALAYYKDRDGFMYFGGINGFNRFHPDSIKLNTFVYPVVFTDFKIFNHSVEPGADSPLKKDITRAEQIVVPHDAYVLTFEYAALNYNRLKGIRYAYKLEGFEENWNEVGDKRNITYTNLSPGDYTLKVKAANSDGIWNNEANLNITVTPPFWRTAWFYVIAFAVIGGLIYAGYNYRVRRIKRQNKFLATKINERTAELHQRNEELVSVLEDLRKTRNELAENAHKAGMADIATGVVHNIGNVLNSIGTSNAITGEVLNKSKFNGLFKANKMLLENSDQMDEFLKKDPKGKKLIEYYRKLDAALKDELELLKQHHQRMDKKVQLINNVINAQQNYASINLNKETLQLNHILEDTLTIFSTSLERHGIELRKNIKPTDLVKVQKTKLVHVILNVLKNAKEAMQDAGVKEPIIDIILTQVNDQVILKIRDNGPGIKPENLGKIFNQGFTTKAKGHGFGMHSSANYMKEMDAIIKVQNAPNGVGAEFILIFQKVTELSDSSI